MRKFGGTRGASPMKISMGWTRELKGQHYPNPLELR